PPGAQLELFEQFGDARRQPRGFDAVELADELEKFAAAELFINERTVGNEAGDRFGPLRRAHHIVAAEQDPARGCLQDAHHHPDRRRFAGAVGAEKAEDFTRRHDQVEIVDGGEPAVAFGKMDELDHDIFGFSILDFRFNTPRLSPPQSKFENLKWKGFDFEMADQLQQIDLAVDLAFEKLDVGDVGGKLVEGGVERHPVAEPDFRPGVVIKRAAQIDDADHGFGRNARRARQGIEQNRVLVAVAFARLQNL